MRLLISIVFLLVIGTSTASSVEISSEDVAGFDIDPNVVFVSSGPWANDDYEHFRAILTNFEIYTTLTVQKVLPATEDTKGKVYWSRILNFGYHNKFIAPNDFVASFQWLSSNSFSFSNNGKSYTVKNIEQPKPLFEPEN